MPASRAFPFPFIAALSLALVAGAAAATEPGEISGDRAVDVAAPVQGLGPRLDPSALDALRGGDDSTQNKVDIHGQVDDNTAQNIASGDNLIGGGAFANASGISTVIQNSGSNVLIQNGMVVNVRFAGSGP